MNIKRLILKTIKWVRSIYDSTELEIIVSPGEVFTSHWEIKSETNEKMVSFCAPGICKEAIYGFIHSKQNILEVPNCIVTPQSDIIQILGVNKVLWDKYYQKNFSKVIPLDSNLCSFSYSYNRIKILKSHKVVHISGAVISLLGVHAHIWAHFLVQFFPKIGYSKSAGLLDGNERVTVLVPDYRDTQVKQIVTDFLKPFSSVNIMIADAKTSYECDKLFYIPSSCYLSNHANYLMACDCVIPKTVFSQLRDNLVVPSIDKISKPCQKKKIYLVRRDTYRSLVNYKEVENYFVSQGFILIEPHLLSLYDKISIFYSAEIIVGPYSSAWTNIMFCQKGTRGMILSNLVRLEDLYLPTMADFFGVNIKLITGVSLNSDIHSDFFISITDIKNQYQNLVYGE